jgi:hypothetical protein
MSKTLAGAKMPSLKDKLAAEEAAAAAAAAEKAAEQIEKVEVKKNPKDYKNKK